MNEMNEKYRRNDEEREDLLRKLKKFTKENLEISKILDEREASYKEL